MGWSASPWYLHIKGNSALVCWPINSTPLSLCKRLTMNVELNYMLNCFTNNRMGPSESNFFFSGYCHRYLEITSINIRKDLVPPQLVAYFYRTTEIYEDEISRCIVLCHQIAIVGALRAFLLSTCLAFHGFQFGVWFNAVVCSVFQFYRQLSCRHGRHSHASD